MTLLHVAKDQAVFEILGGKCLLFGASNPSKGANIPEIFRDTR